MERYDELIKKFQSMVSQTVLGLFDKNKMIEPMVIMLVVKPEEKKPALVIIPGLNDFMRNERTKDQLVDLIKSTKQMFKPIAIALASEGYILLKNANDFKDPKDLEKIGPISEHPDRVEALYITYETHNKSGTESYKINRIGELVELEDYFKQDLVPMNDYHTQGRFSNFLKENYENILETLDQINMN
jgi:hypothetical protein